MTDLSARKTDVSADTRFALRSDGTHWSGGSLWLAYDTQIVFQLVPVATDCRDREDWGDLRLTLIGTQERRQQQQQWRCTYSSESVSESGSRAEKKRRRERKKQEAREPRAAAQQTLLIEGSDCSRRSKRTFLWLSSLEGCYMKDRLHKLLCYVSVCVAPKCVSVS